MVPISSMKTFSSKLLIAVNISLLLFIAILALYTKGTLLKISSLSLPVTETGLRKVEAINYDKRLNPPSETKGLSTNISKMVGNEDRPNIAKYKGKEPMERAQGKARGDVRTGGTNMSVKVTELAKILRETLELPTDRQPRPIKLQCEEIDYKTNRYEQRKPCYNAKCNVKFNRSFEDRVKDVLLSPQYQLSRRQLDAILSLGQNVPKTEVIIASAVSSNHYDEMQMMFKNLHEMVYPTLQNFRVVLFDIGLSPQERRQTEKSCRCQVITFNFDLFPGHMSDRHCYAWKPIIVRTLVERARKLVIWQDASVRWRSRYLEMFHRARTLGLQVFIGGGDKVTANTLHETFQYMQEKECLFESVPEVANAVAVYRADEFNKLAVLTPWARCALEPACICPRDPGVVRYCGKLKPLRCHRFDQSALTLLLGKLFYDQRFRFEIQQPYNTQFVELQRKTLAPNYFRDISNR